MRVKDIVVLRNEKTTDTSRRYIGLENITSWDARFVETTSETEGTNNIFYPNDILFGKLRPYLAKGYIPKYEGICSTEFFVMSCKSGVLPHYLLYVFLSHSVIDFIKNQVAGVKMPRTNWDEFGNLNIDLPSFSVQQKIVDYLDEKTSAIDTQVELLEKKKDAYARLKKAMINRAVTHGLVEHVKLKDSGVEWIGMIPEHWVSLHLKNFVTINNGGDYKHIEAEEGIPVIGSGGIFAHATEKMYDGEVLLLGRKGTIDRPMYYKGAFWAVDTMFYAIPMKNVSAKYLYYCATQFPFSKISTATALPSMTQTDLYQLPVVMPPYEEQQTIAAFLDEKCAKIDAAIANIDKQTDALKRLKRSLINEVITGQRAV